MDAKRIQDDEYEFQYYGISSTEFIQQFKELILDTIKEDLDDIEKESVKNAPDRLQMFQKECSNLFEEYKKVALKHIEEVEEEIRQYFAIPKHVALEQHHVACSQSDIQELEEEIKELEEEYKKKRAIKFVFEKELELLGSLDSLNSRVTNLVDKIKVHQEKEGTLETLLKNHEDMGKKLALLENKHAYILKK